MSQIVEIPGYGTAEFPDEMSQADMAAAIKKRFMPKVSSAEDYSKAAGSGALEGVKDVVGTTVSMLPKTGAMAPAAQTFAPGTNMFLDAASALAKRFLPSYQPQSTGAKYVQEGTRGAVSGSVGGPMGALSGATAGVGGEAGSQFTHGATINVPGVGPIDYGRAVGSFIGGLAPNVPSLVGNYAGTKIRNATQGMTDAEWQAAQQRQAQANQQGILVTGPEALNNKDLLAQQLVAEQHPKSSQIMAEYMRKRGGQVQQAANNAIAPTGPATSDPALLGSNVQQAATDAIAAAEKARTNAVNPLYRQADAMRVPKQDVKGILAQIDADIAADKTGVLRGPLGELRDRLTETKASAAVPGQRFQVKNGQVIKGTPTIPAQERQPITDIENLDRARKYMRDKMDIPEFGQDAIPKEAHAVVTGYLKQLDDAMQSASSPFLQAKEKYAAMSPAINQRIEGTVGDLTKTNNPNTQFARLKDSGLSTPGSIADAAADLKKTNPVAYQQLVRNGLENELDTAMRNMQGTAQEFAGARLARQVRQTPQTQANIEAIISQLPDGKTRLKAWNNLVDTLEVTGNRYPTGSRTSFNNLQIEDMTSAGLNAMRNPAGAAAKWYTTVAQGLTAKQLAQVFTDPESVSLMRKLAFEKPGSDRARAVISVIAGYKKPESPEDENK